MPQFIAENVNQSSFDKNCLIDYTEKPFLYQMRMEAHQNMWQSLELARIVGSYGYNVDVRDYTRKDVRPDRTYDLIIDTHPDAPSTYEGLMRKGCKRIAYMTTANPTFLNREEEKRLDDLYARRGVRLKARRIYPAIDREVSRYDAFCLIGNDFVLQTFRDEFTLPPSFIIRNNGYDDHIPFDPEVKRSDAFLFIGGPGQVHKGLDLLLEVFAARTDAHLFVMGDTQAEPEFDLAYGQELYTHDNIYPLGFVDVHGEMFREAASISSFCLYPSCAEGCPGSVLAAMSAGVIPIVGPACGLDDDEAIVLPDCSLETLRKTVDQYRDTDVSWRKERSDYYRELAATRFSRRAYTESVTAALDAVLR